MEDGISSLTTLRLAEYSALTDTGRRLLAQFNDREVIVYQAYNPELGNWALEHGYFGGGFSFQRTSWIKPNFTWMMHRCGWASKQNQEVKGSCGAYLLERKTDLHPSSEVCHIAILLLCCLPH